MKNIDKFDLKSIVEFLTIRNLDVSGIPNQFVISHRLRKLQRVLNEYIKNVEYMCNILIENINCAENLSLKNKYDFFTYRSNCKKMEFEAEGISFKLHGKGCVAFNKNVFLEWDFGYRSRWCGIDPWKIALTLKKNKSKYKEFYDGEQVNALCKAMTERGTMFEKNGQYYFSIPKNETFKPNFPVDYDTLVIEYHDLKWKIPRNKLIDRFMRKSNAVYNKIYENQDAYMLFFLLNEKEVYKIPYDDIGYPESAIKIMSDVILQKIIKMKM